MKTAGFARALLVLSFATRAALSQKLGPEFNVSADTTDYQRVPAVAADSSGNFIVVWRSSTQSNTLGSIFGQRFSSAGAPLGVEFRANPADHPSTAPAVASDASGNFLVVWATLGPDGDGYGVEGQRYASSGAPLGASFPVNTTTAGTQYRARVASLAAGGFVVAWEDAGAYGLARGVFGRRYAGSGAALGDEFRINTYTSGLEESPDVASDPVGGGFVTAWADDSGHDGDLVGVFAQRYTSSGAPLGIEFRVNTWTTGAQDVPKVAFDSSGNFAIVWQSNQDGSALGVYGQRYESTGQPIGGEFQVNKFTTGNQHTPAVAYDDSGNLFVVWNGIGHEPGAYGIHGRFYTDTGARFGAEFLVNTETSGIKRSPNVTALSAQRFVVVWEGYNVAFTDIGAFGQRIQRCRSSDANGDGKIDVSDVFYLINSLFAGGPAPVCGGDQNDDGATDVADVFYLVNALFAGGPPPA